MVHVLTAGSFFPWKVVQQLTALPLPNAPTPLLSVKNTGQPQNYWHTLVCQHWDRVTSNTSPSHSTFGQWKFWWVEESARENGYANQIHMTVVFVAGIFFGGGTENGTWHNTWPLLQWDCLSYAKARTWIDYSIGISKIKEPSLTYMKTFFAKWLTWYVCWHFLTAASSGRFGHLGIAFIKFVFKYTK